MNENFMVFKVSSNFTITEVVFEDQGLYRCVAYNTVTGGGMRTDSSSLAELTVTRKYVGVCVELYGQFQFSDWKLMICEDRQFL